MAYLMMKPVFISITNKHAAQEENPMKVIKSSTVQLNTVSLVSNWESFHISQCDFTNIFTESILRISVINLRVVRKIKWHCLSRKRSFIEYPFDFLVDYCISFWGKVQPITVEQNINSKCRDLYIATENPGTTQIDPKLIHLHESLIISYNFLLFSIFYIIVDYSLFIRFTV